ncbi:MAG: cytochrome c1 [Gammaproteobacteria bacterium]|nr:cytochrome c1 [Gammaproteobacteria bacterium]MYF30023.1 cytochrome c1 [Gammaproteobacteria bacterium]MYK46317.1 cytochrome c1 [Gammaproteobacteria bacterium]
MAGLLLALTARGASTDVELEPMKPNLQDLPSLQRGMTLYVNYCLGCHSLKFQRYERTADDLGIPHDVALRNLVFPGRARPAGMDGTAIGDLMQTAMPLERAKVWFGKPPPDLTMVDRVRGTAWVYSMLKSFYVDPDRPFGFNNRTYENIGMPHVLVGLQGVPRLVPKRPKSVDILDGLDGVVSKRPDGEYVSDVTAADELPDGGDPVNREYVADLEVDPGTGSMTAEEFDQAAYDIANFLHYVGDPGRLARHRIGVWVLVFLAGLFVLATLLNREYKKDVH